MSSQIFLFLFSAGFGIKLLFFFQFLMLQSYILDLRSCLVFNASNYTFPSFACLFSCSMLDFYFDFHSFFYVFQFLCDFFSSIGHFKWSITFPKLLYIFLLLLLIYNLIVVRQYTFYIVNHLISTDI